MFLLPPKLDKEVSKKLALFREQSAEDLYKSIENRSTLDRDILRRSFSFYTKFDAWESYKY